MTLTQTLGLGLLAIAVVWSAAHFLTHGISRISSRQLWPDHQPERHVPAVKPFDRSNHRASTEQTLDRLYPRDVTGHRVYNPEGSRSVDPTEAA